MTEKDLLQLKEQIDQAKESIAEFTGKLKYLQQELKEKWGCNTIDDAEKKVGELGEDIEKLEDEIETAMADIEEKYKELL